MNKLEASDGAHMERLSKMPGHLLRRAHQASTAIFATHLNGYDITSVQYATLVAIRSQPGIDATRLSAMIGFDRSTLGGVIERLEAKGLIHRSDTRQDRRVRRLALTEDAVKLMEEIGPKVDAVQADIVRGFSATEQRTLVRLLAKIIESSERG